MRGADHASIANPVQQNGARKDSSARQEPWFHRKLPRLTQLSEQIRRVLTDLCAPPRDQQHAPAGHPDVITTNNVHNKATTSDNNFKITKASWSTEHRAFSRGPQ